VQYMVEGLYRVRKGGFEEHPGYHMCVCVCVCVCV
jgi:hypothetical protein